jgi:hypothetical protein
VYRNHTRGTWYFKATLGRDGVAARRGRRGFPTVAEVAELVEGCSEVLTVARSDTTWSQRDGDVVLAQDSRVRMSLLRSSGVMLGG